MYGMDHVTKELKATKLRNTNSSNIVKDLSAITNLARNY